jgi:hypothetical protein
MAPVPPAAGAPRGSAHDLCDALGLGGRERVQLEEIASDADAEHGRHHEGAAERPVLAFGDHGGDLIATEREDRRSARAAWKES